MKPHKSKGVQTFAGNEAELPSVTVAICTYNRYDFLKRSIDSVMKQTFSSSKFEIVVVDNSPSPEVSRKEAEFYKDAFNLIWIYEATPGLSNARNVATAAAKAPIIAFLDDDAIASEEWLTCLLKAFSNLGESVAGVGGPVDPIWGAERPVWLPDKALDFLSVVDLGFEERLLGEGEWLAGANVAYRVRLLRDLGGFSTALGRVGSGISLMSNDETELGDRLARAGFSLAYSPTARVQHHVDASRLSQQWFRRRIAWQAVSEYVRNPADCFYNKDQSWTSVKEFMAHQPPADRTIRALALASRDAGEFQWQMSAIYNSVISLLSGVEETNDE